MKQEKCKKWNEWVEKSSEQSSSDTSLKRSHTHWTTNNWAGSENAPQRSKLVLYLKKKKNPELHMVFLIPWRNGAWEGYSCGVRDTICVLPTTVRARTVYRWMAGRWCVLLPCLYQWGWRSRDTHQIQHERERPALKLKLILSAAA